MSSHVEYQRFRRGESCTEDGCRARKFYIEDGKKFCQRGHEQAVCPHKFICVIVVSNVSRDSRKLSKMKMIGMPKARNRERLARRKSVLRRY
jgi:hypothetical protein